MAALVPYTYIQCPCSDAPAPWRPGSDAQLPSSTTTNSSTTTTTTTTTTRDAHPDADDDRTFDPRAPRANFSLYPLEHLLYCGDCHQIRCPRCVADEIVTYYCPSCLFEVPGSQVKSEGNRCTRSCFQCPVCIGPLAVRSADRPAADPDLPPAPAPDSATAAAYVLNCSYCHWSSTDIGIGFDRAQGIFDQLERTRNGGHARLTAKERRDQRRREAQSAVDRETGETPAAADATATEAAAAAAAHDLDTETHFANLQAFYQAQLTATHAATPGITALADLGFSSPNAFSRLMALYTGDAGASLGGRLGAHGPRPPPFQREAATPAEGLVPAQLDDGAALARLRGAAATTTTAQRRAQPPCLGEPAAQRGRQLRFVDMLRPVQTLLRTKRAKRCPACRHIICKPDAKVAATRFRIRLVAGSYLPTITIRPLPAAAAATGRGHSASVSSTTTTPPEATAGEGGPQQQQQQQQQPQQQLLRPLQPAQFLLTFRNPLFETVRVTLATPARTPGRFGSTVTLLCPQFEMDANTDVWDEALRDGGDKAAEAARRDPAGGEAGGEGAAGRAEAGKIWERGRNWVSVAVEVVPALLRVDRLRAQHPAEDVDASPLREDEDVLEIPVFVRVEWEAEAGADELGSAIGRDRDAREKRELAYWCVLGVGRISQE
ncbi:hypothetical protein P8C59_008454 [Phyllachora maydis]|uniref:Dynactin subunit 4 n=1 Tax=Phyllachora maydis TaxID=1825666 RepID=A0AAD9IB56_9PEZI|nr:hypothetical protein P8C59_008454 [Phyllachora maydis]